MHQGRITKVDVRILSIPLKEKWQTSGYTAHTRSTLVVRLRTEEGVCGYGEASPSLVFNSSTPATQKLVICDHFAPLLTGRSVFEAAALVDEMDRCCKDNGGAKSAIDQACWDAAGKLLGLPVHRLLGGAVVDRVPQVAALGVHDVERSLQIGRSFLKAGYRSLKLKVGVDTKREIEILRLLRSELGEDFSVRVDVNQNFDVAEALHFAEKIAPFAIECMEQPLPYWNFKGMAFVRNRIPFPVMADESCGSFHDVLRLIDVGAADIFNLKIVKMGGIYRARQALSVVEAAGFTAVAGGFELGIGTAASLHLASLSHAMKPANEHFVSPNFEQEIISEPYHLVDGALSVPAAPGLGFGNPLVDFENTGDE